MQNPDIHNESETSSLGTDLGNAGLNEEEDTSAGSSDDNSDESENVISENEPNIIFVGDGVPTTKINDGMVTYKLPKVDVQADVETIPPSKEGEVETKVYTGKQFYHENAGAIIQLFPDQYKRFVKKGS
jgi:hypothetical protein